MKWLDVGMKLIPLISMAVHVVEKIVPHDAPPQTKQDTAVDIIGTGLHLLELGMGKDVLDDAEVQAAVRSAIDAYVHLQNVIAAKKSAAVNPF